METEHTPHPELTPAGDGREDIFVTTRWTLIRDAHSSEPQAQQALEEICQTY